jgi:hypothetical protein
MKWAVCLAGAVLLVSGAGAQQKAIPQPYVRDVLESRTIAVVPYSDRLPADDLQENQRARLEVEMALLKWGRYRVIPDASVADLIVVVRKGRARGTTIGGTKDPVPVVVDPVGNGGIISIHRGQNPPLRRSDAPPTNSHPRIGTEVGSADDLLELYRGRMPLAGDASRNATQYPLDDPPVWLYTAKDALRSPKIEAVVQLRKAVEAAEKKKKKP